MSDSSNTEKDFSEGLDNLSIIIGERKIWDILAALSNLPQDEMLAITGCKTVRGVLNRMAIDDLIERYRAYIELKSMTSFDVVMKGDKRGIIISINDKSFSVLTLNEDKDVVVQIWQSNSVRKVGTCAEVSSILYKYLDCDDDLEEGNDA